MNNVVLLGRLTRDPELIYHSQTGNPMARFSIAVDRQLSKEKRLEFESRNQPTADFINITCWGRLAETVNQFTAKGKRILVFGRLQTGSYEAQDGSRRYTSDVIANSVEFIDWKDKAQKENNDSQHIENSVQEEDDRQSDFFGNDFSPIDDDRIPF